MERKREMIRRIVVVDDDREIREIASFVLSRNGYEVTVAANEQQLQRLLAAGLPDLIILDVMMPGRDGYQLCRILRADELSCHIPVMIMTAHDEGVYERISADLGAVHHLSKPFHPIELVERVNALWMEKKSEDCDKIMGSTQN